LRSAWRLSFGAALAITIWLLSGSGPDARFVQNAAEPTITLRVIVVTAQDAAEQLLDRLNHGESFALAAKTVSTAPSADDGGWLGKVTISQLRPEVRSAVQGLRPGDLTRVVRLPTGFAIFKVESDDPAEAGAESVSAAIAATGAVKFVYDLSGFTDVRTAIESSSPPPGWSEDPRTICQTRTKSLTATRALVNGYLAPGGGGASRSAVDLMELHVLLGQLDAYEGNMAGAVARLEDAARTAAPEGPAAVLPLEEALGIAYLHKAEIDNKVQITPGDYCLLGVRPHRALAEPADAEKAVAHLLKYLDARPDDFEVRWLLNRAAMATGAYPDKVPAALLIPPSAFQSSEDLGRFRDVAPQAGLSGVASAGGVIVEDFGGTGRFDVVSSTMDSCQPMRMMSSNGDGTYTDRTSASGLSTQFGGLNIIAGDYNNDGCPDILVLRGGWEYVPQRLSLLQNDCHGKFVDVTLTAGLGKLTTTQTGVWTDIDNDGWLDLFLGNEAGAAQLYRNNHGVFVDISRAAGVDRSAFTKAVAAADYDNDRYPDLYVSNYGGTNFLYHNNRNGTFTEVSAAARVTGPTMGFGTWFFDYDNDGWPDLFATSYVSSVDEIARGYLGLPRHATTMRLYRNLGDGTFRDVTKEVALDKVQMPMGSNFGDIDNDGWLDIYLGTGQPSYAAAVGSVLLHNKDGRAFVDVTASSGTGEMHKGHGVAFADLDHDGDEDIIFEVGGATPGDRHAMRVFENPGHGNDWIALKLVGVKTNKSAVGARIKVTVQNESGATRSIYRTVGTGGSFGVSPIVQHIGLGKSARIADLEIWWPATDRRQHLAGIGKNQWVRIEEGVDQVTVLERDTMKLGGGRKSP
jgi:hypothetical protein